MDESAVLHPHLLCLKCRQSGHVADYCPSDSWRSEFEWFFSERRRENDIFKALSVPDEIICTRCRDLDTIGLLRNDIPWTSSNALNKVYRQGSLRIPSLGTVGSIRIWKNCALCRCLFGMTPEPRTTKQSIHLLTQWTMNRLTGECSVEMDTEEKRQSPKCLIVVLSPSTHPGEFSDRAHRGDALCLATEKTSGVAAGLVGREINSFQLDTQIIENWISLCLQGHRNSCRPVFTKELPGIRLIDVETRTIVRYPGDNTAYVALSYVWGDAKQTSYQLGSDLKLATLPQTIEDSISLTKKLGKGYLWVDSVCIDQENDADKLDQIDRMWSIYRGAYVTIIALSGTSAHSGLPRMGQDASTQPQLRCSFDGKLLLGLMPTLSQQIWVAPWGKRAWTLQEALLSPRCLYISDHQMYFECNEMQCCESLDERDSWAHKLGHDSGPDVPGWLQSQTGAGCLKNPLDDPADRIGHYGAKLTLYSYRTMTYKSDVLKAFQGILQQLTTLYKKGFHCGLPIEDFQWGLLWRAQTPPKRRLGFPTWSWAGWEAGMWPAYPSSHNQPHQFPVPVRVWKVVSHQLIPIFNSSQSQPPNEQPADLENDPLCHLSLPALEQPELDLSQYAEAEELDYLFIEGIALHFTPNYSNPLTTTRLPGQDALFQFPIRDTLCQLRIMSVDEELRDVPKGKEQRFLLLARDWDRVQGVVLHYLMLLDYDGDGRFKKGVGGAEVAERKTVLEVIVPEKRLHVLGELGMKTEMVVLR